MKVICPGSFDPVTLGHLDIITRAHALFDEVLVGVGQNTSKNALFSPAERQELLESAVAGLDRVRVVPFSGLIVDFCRDNGIGAIVKGLRFAADFDHELQMAQMNDALSGVETILLPTSSRYGYISSTLVREIALLGGDVRQFVPPAVAEQIGKRER